MNEIPILVDFMVGWIYCLPEELRYDLLMELLELDHGTHEETIIPSHPSG